MNHAPISARFLRVALFLAIVSPAPALFAQAEDFTGRLVDTVGALPRRSTAHFQLHVERWTTDEEVQHYLQVLEEQGQEGLQDLLWEVEKGYIRIGNSLGYPIAIARSHDTGEGRTVRVVLDRPIQMWEVMQGLRSVDYPFGIIELELDERGRGEGELYAAAAARILPDGTLDVESYGPRPFRVLNVRAEASESQPTPTSTSASP